MMIEKLTKISLLISDHPSTQNTFGHPFNGVGKQRIEVFVGTFSASPSAGSRICISEN